ncbi:MAG: S16 family serine protease, partial [Phycisphaerae bacterium]
KVIAAQRAGIKTVILPERNRKNLEEINAEVRRTLKFVFAERVDDVLKLALGPKATNGKPARPAAKR